MQRQEIVELLELARQSSTIIATAESCTGGMVAAALTAIPGASDVVDCGFITYSNRAKQGMLGVAAATLATHGAVSEPVAAEMAAGALARSSATLTVAVTGIAGPGGSGNKPEGRVCFAIATAEGVQAKTVDFGALGRDHVRVAACDHALRLLARELAPHRSR